MECWHVKEKIALSGVGIKEIVMNFKKDPDWLFKNKSPCEQGCSMAEDGCVKVTCSTYDAWVFAKEVPLEDVPLYLGKFPKEAAHRLKARR
jgi:hypothetical protein